MEAHRLSAQLYSALDSPAVKLRVTADSALHSIFVHRSVLEQIPYFKESSWCTGKETIDITLPDGVGIEPLKCLLCRFYGSQIHNISAKIACEVVELADFLLIRDMSEELVNVLKSTLTNAEAVDEALLCFKGKAIPSNLQHLLSTRTKVQGGLALDVIDWSSVSVKAMLENLLPAVCTAPESLDPAKPSCPSSAMDLYYKEGNYVWGQLSSEETKKWQEKYEKARQAFREKEGPWKAARAIAKARLSSVAEIFERRCSQGLAEIDIEAMCQMLRGGSSFAAGVAPYFASKEHVHESKVKDRDEKFKFKCITYSLKPGFESLMSIASIMAAAQPDKWVVLVWHFVRGLPVHKLPKSAKNEDGSFCFKTVGVQVESPCGNLLPGNAGGFIHDRVEKACAAFLQHGILMCSRQQLQPVDLTIAFGMLSSHQESEEQKSYCSRHWLTELFGGLVAVLDHKNRALLIDTLMSEKVPSELKTRWDTICGTQSWRYRSLSLQSKEDRVTLVEDLMQPPVFGLFDDLVQQQICTFLMCSKEIFPFWIKSEHIQVMSLELQASCVAWFGKHVQHIAAEGYADDMADEWLDAFHTSSPAFEKALAVALLPLFPVVEDELADRIRSLALPNSGKDKITTSAESLEADDGEPATKHRRMEDR